MQTFSLSPYAPSVSAKVTAEEVYFKIMELDPKNNAIQIDVTDIVAMTTICARVIFGNLFIELGKELFAKNVSIIGMSDALKIVINWGIESAINNEY